MAKVGSEDSDSHSNPWSSFQCDLLCLVGEKIEFIEDFVSFCAVCRRWYVFGTELYSRKKKLDFNSPFYLPDFDPRTRNPKLNFRSYRNYMVDQPERTRRSWGWWWRSILGFRCWGSQFGWLVTYSPRNDEFSLVNPFSGATISLPPFDRSLFDLEDLSWCIRAFLTADPVESPEDCIVIVAHGPSLAFARPAWRDRAWYGIPDQALLVDVMSFRGGLYGIAEDGHQALFDVVSIQIQPSPRVVVLLRIELLPGDPALGLAGRDLDVDYFIDPLRPQLVEFFPINRKYIVELEGELCVVVRYMERNAAGPFVTGYFKVFRVDLSTGKLARVWSLGDRCLFLGNGGTFTCKVGSKSNLVVYTHVDDETLSWFNNKPRYRDEGVWDMSSSKKIYSSTGHLAIYPSSLWFVPSVISFKTLEQVEEEVEERSKRKGTVRCFRC